MLQAFSQAQASNQRSRAVTCRAEHCDKLSTESGENLVIFNGPISFHVFQQPSTGAKSHTVCTCHQLSGAGSCFTLPRLRQLGACGLFQLVHSLQVKSSLRTSCMTMELDIVFSQRRVMHRCEAGSAGCNRGQKGG